MNWRERAVWLIAILSLGVSLMWVPGSFLVRKDQRDFADPILEVRERLAANYVDEISKDQLDRQFADAAIAGMLQPLDPYTQFFPPVEAEQFQRLMTGNFKGIGVQLGLTPDGEIQVVTPMDDSPALEAGLVPGDVILSAGGTKLQGLKFDDVRTFIAGPEGTSVELLIRKSDGSEVKKSVVRRNIVSPTLFGLFRNSDGSQNFWLDTETKIAYIRITQFTPETAEHLQDEILKLRSLDMKSLVLDLRFNPGGELAEAVAMSNLFIDQGVIVRTRGLHRAEQTYSVDSGKTLPFFPVALLINSSSASASEIVAGALAEHRRATLVGERTFGKGSVQEPMAMPKGAMLKMTVAHYYLPSGRLLHRKPDSTEWGVDPQIVVTLDPQQTEAVLTYWNQSQIFYSREQAATRPATTRPVDSQLESARQVLVAEMLLRK